eukprot:Pgem_evm1s6458
MCKVKELSRQVHSLNLMQEQINYKAATPAGGTPTPTLTPTPSPSPTPSPPSSSSSGTGIITRSRSTSITTELRDRSYSFNENVNINKHPMYHCKFPGCPSEMVAKKHNIQRHVWMKHIRKQPQFSLCSKNHFTADKQHLVNEYVVRSNLTCSAITKSKSLNTLLKLANPSDDLKRTTSLNILH